MRIELKEKFGDRPASTLATASLLEDGTIEIVGEPTNVEFLAQFRVNEPGTDRWVTKDEDPQLWLELMPSLIKTPYRWIETFD